MIESVVHAGAMETRYRRAGQGPQLLLLATGGEGQREVEWLAGAIPPLVDRFRVFVPEVPADAGPAWLRGMIDGLGLDRPGVVADATLGELVARFLETDAERLERVAIVHPDGAAGPAPESPVLRWFRSPGDAGVMASLLAFLDPGR
jgi:hypothetical protein